MTSLGIIVAIALGAVVGSGATWLLLRRVRACPDKEEDDLFRILFEAAPECVKMQSREGVIEQMNAAGLSLLEASHPDRIVGRSVYEFIAPEHHSAYQELTASVFQGQQDTLEFELVNQRGHRRCLESHAVPLRRAPDNTVTSLLAITRDTTERNWMMRRLEEQHNHLQTIIESEPECVKLHDRQGTILEINPAGQALLDAETPNQLVGREIYEFLLPAYHSDYRSLTQRVFTGERATMEFEVMGLSGRRHWLETHATPLYNNDNEISAVLAITRNIDERKQNEAKLRQQQAELVHVCRISTLSALSSGLAHELNQPLSAISSFAESASELCNDDDEVQKLLGRIIEQSDRAESIINRLRDFLRKRTPHPAPTEPGTIVDNVLRFTNAELNHYGIALRREIAPNLPPLQADRVQIEQVLINLITNAIQALAQLTAEERRLRLAVKAQAGDAVLFQVADNGHGISPEERERLFAPFFTTREEGLGLGLSISRTIIENHGGQIGYERKAGETRFCFTLPVTGP